MATEVKNAPVEDAIVEEPEPTAPIVEQLMARIAELEDAQLKASQLYTSKMEVENERLSVGEMVSKKSIDLRNTGVVPKLKEGDQVRLKLNSEKGKLSYDYLLNAGAIASGDSLPIGRVLDLSSITRYGPKYTVRFPGLGTDNCIEEELEYVRPGKRV